MCARIVFHRRGNCVQTMCTVYRLLLYEHCKIVASTNRAVRNNIIMIIVYNV